MNQQQEQKPEAIEYEYATLKSSVNINMLRQNSIEDMLISQSWSIRQQQISRQVQNDKILKNSLIMNQNYHSHNWKIIFQNMIQSRAIQMRLVGNDNQQILSQISHLKFISLKHLMLIDNKINNIQILSQLSCHNLQSISLFYNHITSIKSFNKVFFKQLICINFGQNPIKHHINALSRMKINQKLLFALYLSQWNANDQIAQDLSCFVKLSIFNMKTICVQSANRIKQKNVYEMLKEKKYIRLQLKTLE